MVVVTVDERIQCDFPVYEPSHSLFIPLPSHFLISFDKTQSRVPLTPRNKIGEGDFERPQTVGGSGLLRRKEQIKILF